MVYRSRSHPEPTARKIDPYALVHRWGWWYVIGHCCLRDAMRTFRVDRILDLTILPDTYEIPPEFDVRRYLAEANWFPAQIQVRMRFSPRAALEARDEGRSWDTAEEEPDGSLVVTFGATDLDWAARVALWYGPDAEVLEPEELRCRVEEWARTAAAQYASDQSSHSSSS